MKPCYIVTYYVEGPCAVDANEVIKFKDEQVGGFDRCRLYFNDGSELRLEENCDNFKAKRDYCKPDYPHDLPLFPKTLPKI